MIECNTFRHAIKNGKGVSGVRMYMFHAQTQMYIYKDVIFSLFVLEGQKES